jgi:HSP20 family molecular chaperone IbpA
MAFYFTYPPTAWHPSTYVANTYPEHHLPLHAARHKIAHAMHEVFVGNDDGVNCPPVDIRETPKRYYIDMELPGLTSTTALTISWTNPSVIVVGGKLIRNPIQEESAAIITPEKETVHDKNGDSGSAKNGLEQKDHHAVHYLQKERNVGTFMRSFGFAAEVDHDTMKATLGHGLLTLAIDKMPHKDMKSKSVEVQLVDKLTTIDPKPVS